jgi:integrase
LPESRPRTDFFLPDQFERLLKELPPHLKGGFTLSYWTGVRRSEAFGLRWTQVDMAERLLFLQKTKNGEDRTLAMNDELYALFKHEWANRWPECAYVFHRRGEESRALHQ